MRKTTFLIAILAMILTCSGGAMADEPEASKGKTESKDKGKGGKGKDGDKGKTESKDKDKGGDKGKGEDPPTDKDWTPPKPILGEF